MWIPAGACIVCLFSGFPALLAAEVNVAIGSLCCASSEYSKKFSCEKAVDGRTNSDYASALQGVGMWYKMDLRNYYHITRLRIMDRYNAEEKNKELSLTFSDSSAQTITFPYSGAGIRWTAFTIVPVNTYSVIIEVISVHASGNNGFVEIQIFADTSFIPTAQVQMCPYQLVGVPPIDQSTWALIRQNKPCILTCTRIKECVAVLVGLDGGVCINYYVECVATKVQYGIGYTMLRPKRS